MPQFFRRIHYLLNRRRLEKELADDMAFHREMAARQGVGNFGNILRLREESRDAWGWTWIDRLLQDLRFTARLMLRSPGFTLLAVLMLAAGIAINVAAFGFFNLVLFQPLPVPEPDSLVRLHRTAPGYYSSDLPYTAMDFYRQNTKSLSAVLALQSDTLRMGEAQQQVKGFFVTPNFHTELGAAVTFGRTLHPNLDGDPSAEPAAVLGYDFWQRQFGGNPAIVGQQIQLNGKAARVVGIVARSFSGLTYSLPDVWLPLESQSLFVEGSELLTSVSAEDDGVDVWGRLRQATPVDAAREELAMLAGELRKIYPEMVWKGESLLLRPGGYAQNAGGRERSSTVPQTMQQEMLPLFAMIAVFSLMLLTVACANLGSLLLARGAVREREIAIRKSVGAATGRLLRQLLTESLVLAVLGSALGLYSGLLILDVVVRWSGGPGWLEFSPDWRTVLYTVLVGSGAALVFGLTPALHAVRQQHRATRTRRVLVVAQVAASCVLLVVAGLLVRALGNALYADPGFQYKQVVSIHPVLDAHGYSTAASRAALDAMQSRLRALPGVQSVSIALCPPFGGRVMATELGPESDKIRVYLNRVTPEFFDTMQVRFLQGRPLVAGEQNTVVISDVLAARLWPGEPPLDHEVPLGDQRLRVVGVTASARMVALSDSESAEVYQLPNDDDFPIMSILVRTAGPVESLTRDALSIVQGVDPKLMPSARTLEAAFLRRLESTERSAMVVSALGVVALLLACFGIVGIVSYEVSQRTREIGIRVALGARPFQVMHAVLRSFSMPIALGVAIGAVLAAGVSQFLVGELYGISHLDPVAYLAAAALLVLASALAALPAARRALRVNPVQALRSN